MSHSPTNPHEPPRAIDSHPEKSDAASVDAPSDAPPTRARYGVLGFSVSMALLLYLDRFAFSVAQRTIRKELDLDDQDMGYAQSAFFCAYALAQVPAAWLSQRFGARVTLALYVLVWSLAFAGMGAISGLWSLIFFRGLLGLAQAGAYPCAGGFIKNWFPLHERGMANSCTSVGGRGGNLVANLLTPQLMLVAGMLLGSAEGRWRWVFGLYALVGVAWSLWFWIRFRDSPHELSRCNDAERQLITGGHAAVSPPRSADAPPIWAMLTSPTVLLLCLIGVFVNIGWIFLATFLQTYLQDIHHIDLGVVGLLAALPGIASMCGGILGGLTTDRLVRRVGLTWGRRLPGIIATGGAAVAYMVCLSTDRLEILVICFAAAGFLIDFGLGSLWAVYQDIAGKHVSTVLGFANMCGNLGAGGFAVVIGFLAKAGEWSAMFSFASAALLITMMCWRFVNPSRLLVARNK